MSEIFRLERTRNYLQPGDVGAAVRLWRNHVGRSERELWHDYEWGNAHWYCCGSPLEARALLDTLTSALSRRSARELHLVIDRLDGFRNRPSPPYEAGEG
ncbi:hypothetical protein ACIRL2_36685 [Embleya sp. NPDC127516]|uniref:hypothetical protein n=1 Tax=Embleya sp. NPDC127516 TaxID=3363990 RepID=UPI00382EFBBB